VRNRLISFLSIFSLFLTSPLISVNAADSSERTSKFLQIPYKAWNEFKAFQNVSSVKVKVKMHASQNYDSKSKMLYQKGYEDVLNRFSNYFDSNDTFHIIMAGNYDDAVKFTDEVIAELPEYTEYKTRHLSMAKNNFTGQASSFSGGTSSRGCIYSGSKYGHQGSTQIPCPQLKGGVIYFYNANPKDVKWIERIGAHEAFHLVMSKINPMSHFNVPEWIIEGTIEAISFATVTNSNNYKDKNYFFNPTPEWNRMGSREGYDLDLLDYPKGQMSDEKFSIGFLAISLLTADVGVKKLFEFISIFGFPRDWKKDFNEVFGFSAQEFYEKFKDYHYWYFYDGGYDLIQNYRYFPQATSKTTSTKKITITCTKGKNVKKVTGSDPNCSVGFRKKL
jgi:hypothetical protein